VVRAIAAAHISRQRHSVGTLADLAARIERDGIASSAILVISDIVAGCANLAAQAGADAASPREAVAA
jgi:precorrin-4 methylase